MRYRLTHAACALLLGGCYRYVPFTPAAVAPGTELRLYLTGEGSARVAPTLGAQTTVVAGRADGAGDPLRLMVSSTTKEWGGTVRWVGERVTIPLGAIARGERRVLDRRRTTLVGAGVAAATVAAYAVLRAVTGGGSDDGGPAPVPTP